MIACHFMPAKPTMFFLSLTRSYFFHRSKREHSCEIYTIPNSYGIDVTRDMTNAYSATVMHKYYKTMRKNGTFPVDPSFGAKLVGTGTS